jgi:hypothetical protein
VFLVPRFLIPGAAAVVKSQSREALADAVLHICYHWLFYYQWLLRALAPSAGWQNPGVDGMHKFWWRHKLQIFPQEPHVHFQRRAINQFSL